MTNRIDLHIHSTASDGMFTPSELVGLALEKQMVVIAVTDHDTTAGVEEALAAARGTNLTVIPGVEINTTVPGNAELHILGYHIDCQYAPLQERLRALRESRRVRAQEMIDRLAEAGYPLAWDRLLELAGPGSIGRPHIAQAMVEAHYVHTIEHAFRLYIGRGASAYVERDKLSPEDAIDLIRAAGGTPVLAHPSQVIERLPSLVRAGLAGLEAYYYGYDPAERRFLAKLAEKHHLIATGGSDFHGPGITSAGDLGQIDVPESAVEGLNAYASRSPVNS